MNLGTTNKRKWAIALLFIFIFVLFMQFKSSEATVVMAATTAEEVFAEQYCSTWDEYQQASGLEDATWNDVVDAMDQVIATASEKYASGDATGAYDCINDAYYGYYETTGFERIAMGYISGSRKTEMELQFSTCKAVTKNSGSTDEFDEAGQKLSEMLRTDANTLDGTTGNSDSSSSTDSSHVNVATDVFAEQYCATWEEYQAASGLEEATWNDVVDAMDEVIAVAAEKYASGDAAGAYDCINDDYYGYYETTGFERIAMGYISGSRKTEMELQFSTCKAVTKDGGTTEEFNEACTKLSSMLREDANTLDGTTSDSSEDTQEQEESSGSTRSAAAAVFIACFSIILREGFEAILVVGAIVAYLLKAKSQDSKLSPKPVYVGAILGIVASAISAWAFNLLKIANSASQEVIEGVTALIAVVVLYWVSNWMVSKSESEAWSAYIKNKVGQSAQAGSIGALTFTAFLAVYREGAEVILFFQPMLAGDNINMVWWGFAIGCVCLVFVYLAIRLLSFKVPLKPFFLATSILMFIMSIAFLGSGIKELIEGDVITMWAPSWVQWIPSNQVLEVLGVYPCGQTVVAQLILLIVTIVVWIWHMKKNKQIRQQAASEAE